MNKEVKRILDIVKSHNNNEQTQYKYYGARNGCSGTFSNDVLTRYLNETASQFLSVEIIENNVALIKFYGISIEFTFPYRVRAGNDEVL